MSASACDCQGVLPQIAAAALAFAWIWASAQTPAPTATQARPGTSRALADVPVSPDGRYALQVLAEFVSVHASADPQSAVIAQLQQGARVEAVERRGNGYRITLADGRAGWVFYAVGRPNPNFSVDAAPGLGRPLPGKEGAAVAKKEGEAGAPPTAEVPDDRVIQQRPMGKPLEPIIPEIDPKQVPPPTPDLPRTTIPLPDRWRLVDELGVVNQRWYDPYNPNQWKGDRPIPGKEDIFFVFTALSDTLYEARKVPTGIGAQSTERPQSNDMFGQPEQWTFNENLVLTFSLLKGDTTFKPPEWEFRIVPVLNYNYNRIGEVRGLNIDPRRGTTRAQGVVAIQELFFDYEYRIVSDRYDFDDVRVGIQPFISDFRGFLFNDQPVGIRFFGTRDNNLWQYNLAWFRPMEKYTNSGLNNITKAPRQQDIFVGNLYRQDWPVQGFTTQATAYYVDNRESATFFDDNGFQIRPSVRGDARPYNYRVGYLGLNGDGHFGRWNFTGAAYWVFGRVDHDQVAQQEVDVNAGYIVGELSRDFDWYRVRGTALFATGDSDPFDGKATGFDSILENPQIAGAGTSYWIRQAIPLIGGGGVALTGRNAVLANLRSSQNQGQANYSNPGTILVGVGTDIDLTPRWRLIGNLNALWFANTSSLSVLRNQGSIDRHIGTDVSVAVQYRPLFNQNIILNASAASLIPGGGLKKLYGNDQTQYSILVNLLLTY